MSNLTLDSLRSKTPDELEERFRRGERPLRRNLLGDLDGEILATGHSNPYVLPYKPGLSLGGFTPLPWLGKSFYKTDGTVEGVNRLLIDALTLLPFDTMNATALLDGQPCVALDYDRPENSSRQRTLRDDLRRISDSVFLGIVYRRTPDPEPVVYFALEDPTAE